ncbi:MAG: HIT family protein [Cohnella sp.]|nr:HIT family protein [Cohnella sp.]
MECFICQKHRGNAIVPGGAVYEDDLVYIGHRGFGDEPGHLGYMMIDIKRHANGLGDLTDDEAAAVGIWTNRVSEALKIVADAEHVYAYVHGDAVPHFHMHIVPRYAEAPDAHRNPMTAAAWDGAPRGGPQQIEAICKQIRERLRRFA